MFMIGTTFTIDTRDAEFAAVFKDIGKSIENPADLFGRKWYQSDARYETNRDGFHGVYVFQRLEALSKEAKA